MYDALVSADIVVDDPDASAGVLVGLFEFPPPRPSAFLEPPGHGFRAAWLRTQPSLRTTPTQLELIAHRPRTAPHDYVEERIVAQGDRPVRTHATVLAGDVDAVLAHLRARNVPHRVTPPGEDFGFPRVWVGVTAQNPLGYQPLVDAGLWVEVVPSDGVGIPATAQPPSDKGPGVHRVRARRFLVSDIDSAVQALAANLALAPTALQWHEGEATATYTFRNAGSAAIELHQPAPGSEAGRFHERWGDGPYTIVLEVGDLDHVASVLAARGVTTGRRTNPHGDVVLVPDPTRTLHVPIELVEASTSAEIAPMTTKEEAWI